MQVTGKRTTFLDRLGIAIRGHTDPVLLSSHINAGGMRVDEGHMLEGGCGLLAFFEPYVPPVRGRAGRARKDATSAAQGYTRRRRAARLFHLDGTSAQRWRNANTALEATGHSVRFWAGVSLYLVARASAWAFGFTGKRQVGMQLT